VAEFIETEDEAGVEAFWGQVKTNLQAGRIRLVFVAEEITMEPTAEIPQLLRELYRIVGRLETLFPGRRFTLDGHLVGSIGKVLAAHSYGLELLPPSAETHDAQAADGRLGQIKATQRTSVGLGSSPDHLLVLQILPGGAWRENYNGPGWPGRTRARCKRTVTAPSRRAGSRG